MKRSPNEEKPCASTSFSISRTWNFMREAQLENLAFAFSKKEGEISVKVYEEKRLPKMGKA